MKRARLGFRTLCVGSLCLAGVCGGGPAEARHARRHHYAYVPSVPSADAVELSVLAPPTRYATAAQTYGDAAFARARNQRRDRNAEATADPRVIPFGIDPCEPRSAGPSGYSCDGDPTRPGYGQYYSYMPTNASAPQVPRYDPGAQSPILAPVTGLFWVVNAARLDPHN